MTEGKSSWDTYWGEESNRDYWLEPDRVVVELVGRLDRVRVKDVLDLGCGVGRHTLYLAEAGFNVMAVDSSAEALKVMKKQIPEKTVKIKVIEGDYCQDLFPGDSFDFILSYNVLYHGYRETFRKAIRLIHGWLRTGGRLFFTCPTREDDRYGSGEMAAPHTYRPINSIHSGDIHYFTDEEDIYDFLNEFHDVSVNIDEHYWDNKGTRQFSSYRQIEAVK